MSQGEKRPFRVIIKLKKVAEFETCLEALRDFFPRIHQMLKVGVSLQILETMNFIEYDIMFSDGQSVRSPMNFYDARDFAHEIGLMKGKGKMQRDVTEIPDEVVRRKFASIMSKYFERCILDKDPRALKTLMDVFCSKATKDGINLGNLALRK